MKIEIYLKPQLEELWNRWHPSDCLRCGKPMDRKPARNALSRYADVDICNACGMDEALRDYAKTPLPLREWNAVTTGKVKAMQDAETVYLKDTCCFSHIYKDTITVSLCSTPRPASEVVYSRSDHDSRQWWTTWHQCQPRHASETLSREIDAFQNAPFQLPEMENLGTMAQLKRFGEAANDPTEFNLYSETEHFYIWLRFILRTGDYNSYCHYYLK